MSKVSCDTLDTYNYVPATTIGRRDTADCTGCKSESHPGACMRCSRVTPRPGAVRSGGCAPDYPLSLADTTLVDVSAGLYSLSFPVESRILRGTDSQAKASSQNYIRSAYRAADRFILLKYISILNIEKTGW